MSARGKSRLSEDIGLCRGFAPRLNGVGWNIGYSFNEK
jgi:hypothetical protein